MEEEVVSGAAELGCRGEVWSSAVVGDRGVLVGGEVLAASTADVVLAMSTASSVVDLLVLPCSGEDF